MKIQWNSQNYQVANTLFAFIYDQNLNVWNGSAFVATGSTTAAACAITMSQIAGTVWYDANVPAAIQPGFYQVIFCDLAVAAFTPSIGSNPLLIPTPGYTPPSPGAPQTPAPLGTSYIDLVNQVGDLLYKMKPTASDVITDGVAGSTQATEILRDPQGPSAGLLSAGRIPLVVPSHRAADRDDCRLQHGNDHG